MSENASYTVNKKEEIRKLDKAGEVIVEFRIWATSRGGTYFHVDVPEAELDKAAALLEARAKHLDSI